MEKIEKILGALRTKTDGCLIPDKRTGRIYEISGGMVAIVPTRQTAIEIRRRDDNLSENNPPVMRIEEKTDGSIHIFIPWTVPVNVAETEHMKIIIFLLEKLAPFCKQNDKRSSADG